MASQYPPKKNTAFTLDFTLYKNDGTVIANPGTITKKVSIDGGDVADIAASVTEENTTYGQCSLVLSADEMNGDRIWVQIKDDTTGCVPLTIVLNTVANTLDDGVNVRAISGDTGAADNLESYCDGTTPIPANVTQVSGDSAAADNLESYCDGTTPIPANATQVSGDTTAADNLEAAYDGTGYAGGTIKQDVNVASMATDSLTAAALKDDALAEIGVEVDEHVDYYMTLYGLNHLIKDAVVGADVGDNSIIARLVSKSATADWDTYSNQTDSLEAIRDRGDLSWLTGSGAAADLYYVPDSATRTVGDDDGGVLADMATVNGTSFVTGEVTTTTLLEVLLGFTIEATANPASLKVWGYYSGGAGHYISVQAKDAVSGTWETLGTMPTGAAVQLYTFGLLPNHKATLTGVVEIRFLHSPPGTGITSHALYLDKVEVTAQSAASLDAAAVWAYESRELTEAADANLVAIGGVTLASGNAELYLKHLNVNNSNGDGITIEGTHNGISAIGGTGHAGIEASGDAAGINAFGNDYGVNAEGMNSDGSGMRLNGGASGDDLLLAGSDAPTVASVIWDALRNEHTADGTYGDVAEWASVGGGATAEDVWGYTTRALTDKSGFSPSAADNATAVWASGTRTLTSFGSLVADVATAVWGAATRTLSAFGFGVTVATNSDKTGYSGVATNMITQPPSAEDVAAAVWDEERVAHTDEGSYGAVSEWASAGGLDAAGVRLAIGMAEANLDTQLGEIAGYLNSEVADILSIVQKMDSTLELDGMVYRFTTNAMENAPSGGAEFVAKVLSANVEVDVDNSTITWMDKDTQEILVQKVYDNSGNLSEVP